MPLLESIATGRNHPPSPHAIFCSLPSLKSVLDYENKVPELREQMEGGYPRFTNTHFTRKLEQNIAREQLGTQYEARLVSSEKMTQELLRFLRYNLSRPQDKELRNHLRLHQDATLNWVSYPKGQSDLGRAIALFLQHTGSMLYSRESEDILLSKKWTPSANRTPEWDALAYSKKLEDKLRKQVSTQPPPLPLSLASLLGLSDSEASYLHLANSGMGAFFAAYQSACQIQRQRGRKIWLHLGWLFLDSMEVLKKFAYLNYSPSEKVSSLELRQSYLNLLQVLDLQELIEILRTPTAKEIAGIIVETPSNPLLQTPPMAELHELCRNAGVLLVIDPSLAGMGNLNVLKYSDILVSSLSKYHAWSGDVLGGLAVVNPESPFAAELCAYLPEYIEPPYERDLARLQLLSLHYNTIMEKIQQNCLKVAHYLEKHKGIKHLHWAHSPSSYKNYQALSQSEAKCGGVISILLAPHISFQKFYDSLSMPKGPSFGLCFSLMCPFPYLAHYDLIQSREGSSLLAKHGVSPQLLRLSVGIEDPEWICATLEDAFQKARAEHG